MSQKLVSIIIPCFNAAKTVRRTLDTILRQSYAPLEIIAVDDGSTDDSRRILEQYRPQIQVLTQKNSGASSARNAGFRISQGELLLFCDADVIMRQDMVEKMAHTLHTHPEKAYCYSDFRFGYHTFDLFPFDAERLRRENYISTMSLIRRECFLLFDESLKRFQDWDLWKRMLDKGYEGIWYPERLFSAPLSRRGISALNISEILTTIKNKFLK